MRKTWVLLGIVGVIALVCGVNGLFADGLAADANGAALRVGLRYFGKATQTTVSATGAYTVRSADSTFLAPGNSTGSTSIIVSTDGLAVVSGGTRKVVACGSVTLSPESPAVLLAISSPGCKQRSYRGTLEITTRNGRLLLVNVVDVEGYLKGVLPPEMPASYPIEALKAQAVTARTYAIANRRKHLPDGYTLCDQSDCQLYTGAASERETCSKAVDETVGLIVSYNGKPASVMYSSDCGGATADYSATNPANVHPYLNGVAEPDGVVHGQWTLTLSLDEIAAKLPKPKERREQPTLPTGVTDKRGQSTGDSPLLSTLSSPASDRLTGLAVASRDRFGRVTALELSTETANSTIAAPAFRSAIGVSVIKSTMFDITEPTDATVTFTGKGLGHGVGLCQKGARALALPPFSMGFEDILEHYFPGTEVAVY